MCSLESSLIAALINDTNLILICRNFQYLSLGSWGLINFFFFLWEGRQGSSFRGLIARVGWLRGCLPCLSSIPLPVSGNTDSFSVGNTLYAIWLCWSLDYSLLPPTPLCVCAHTHTAHRHRHWWKTVKGIQCPALLISYFLQAGPLQIWSLLFWLSSLASEDLPVFL